MTESSQPKNCMTRLRLDFCMMERAGSTTPKILFCYSGMTKQRIPLIPKQNWSMLSPFWYMYMFSAEKRGRNFEATHARKFLPPILLNKSNLLKLSRWISSEISSRKFMGNWLMNMSSPVMLRLWSYQRAFLMLKYSSFVILYLVFMLFRKRSFSYRAACELSQLVIRAPNAPEIKLKARTPVTMITIEKRRSIVVLAEMSPYPTVDIVVTVQQIEVMYRSKGAQYQ